MEIILKRAEVKDAELLTEMRLEMRKERETAHRHMSDEEISRHMLDFFRTHISDGSFISYIAWDGAQAAACSGLSIQVHPPTYENPTGKHGYISNMFTRPAWRRMGIAKLLVDRLAAAAKEVGCAQLYLNASPMGRSVYVRYGFQPVNGEMVFDLLK
ncbi:MAG: GNAT family N-acetyltransferase [Lentisphaeria bacterium]|nr:GNAT family N-acetyltransferase [Lentisphaeria bacterium]